jgi:predicted  nucleic acid-binding Zn ribbon protein
MFKKNFVVAFVADCKLLIVGCCPLCNKQWELTVLESEFDAWFVDGQLIQHAMPSLSGSERELLISNICPHCWDLHFSNLEEDDSDMQRELEFEMMCNEEGEKNKQ